MVLKEAFREQNFLEQLIIKAISYLSRTDNITNKKQEHLRKAANPDAENECMDIPKSVVVDYTPNDVINFVMDVLEEKEKLTTAISKAKAECDNDIDALISTNKFKQRVAATFKSMADVKASEKVITGYGKKFDVNGVQQNYSYDVNETVTIDFDRNVVKTLFKKLTNESDNVSTEIDKLNVCLEVDYTPVYEIGDSLDDCIEVFLSNK